LLVESKDMDAADMHAALAVLGENGAPVLQNDDGIRPGSIWALLDT
jgi:hypothetical protein